MFDVQFTDIFGFNEAIRGMRNSWNSWDKSDTTDTVIGKNDLTLMQTLAQKGSSHAKFRRAIVVYADITAPLYWWKEFDTYKVGTTSLSTSTMHTITEKEFELEDFQADFLNRNSITLLEQTCNYLNECRQLYLETGRSIHWYQIIQLLPSSYLQKRLVVLNYEVLANIYRDRKKHKLLEWERMCSKIKELPYAEQLIFPMESDNEH